MPINEHSYDAENMGGMILRLSIGSEVDWSPEHLAMSAWIEHLPFAFWLMKILRPRMLVELGTDKGTSYAGFCQAVESLHLDTNCFAVDTWKGDQHAGYYDESVFSVVNLFKRSAIQTLFVAHAHNVRRGYHALCGW